MKRETCKVLIIGGGPGGYVCAIRAAQLGLDTVVVEQSRPGGTCLNVGCIPSKALIHAADEFLKAKEHAAGNSLGITTSAPAIDLTRTTAWKDGIVNRLTGGVGGLLRKAGARLIEGRARLLDGKTAEVETPEGPLRIQADYVVIATGSRPVDLPGLPFGGDILSSTGMLSLTEVPETLAIVGGGYIGLEIGTAFAKLGAAVTVLEAGPRILPQYDAELTRPVAARLKALGVSVITGAKAESYSGGQLVVQTADGGAGVAAARIMVAVGRAPVTEALALKIWACGCRGVFWRSMTAARPRCAASMPSGM